LIWVNVDFTTSENSPLPARRYLGAFQPHQQQDRGDRLELRHRSQSMRLCGPVCVLGIAPAYSDNHDSFFACPDKFEPTIVLNNKEERSTPAGPSSIIDLD